VTTCHGQRSLAVFLHTHWREAAHGALSICNFLQFSFLRYSSLASKCPGKRIA
jgi:hypothetical protein